MNLPVTRNDLTSFLLAAKRHTYASEEADSLVPPVLTGSRQMEYRQGSLFYRDIYYGELYFVGQEIIYHDSSPLWAMGYAGGVIKGAVPPSGVEELYDFLRAALRQARAERPFRGPSIFGRGTYVYTDDTEGGLERFYGVETISLRGRRVYELHYSGGILL
jgi:hypothetical protein